MPAGRELTPRQLQQMLRLHHDGVSARKIGGPQASGGIRPNLASIL